MIHIEPLRPADWNAALHQALARVATEQRSARVTHCVQLLETGVLDPRGVWIARSGGAIVGVQVCVPLAGASCLFWIPAGKDTALSPLVQAGLDWCRSIGCKLAQALVTPDDRPFARPLIRQGFRQITRMQQLGRDLADLPAAPPVPVRCEKYRPSRIPDFAATLERTYDGTLDCPELNGKRTIDEILAGHRGQGKFDPDFWWLAYDGNLPIGIVMMIEMPDGLSWELAYVGLIPEYRRRGLGRSLTIQALRALHDQPATRLIVAVDERNEPARQLYQSLGFVETESNDVLLHFFP